jgi:photosystem II stability/assembly factor-like uncharacterized protein
MSVRRSTVLIPARAWSRDRQRRDSVDDGWRERLDGCRRQGPRRFLSSLFFLDERRGWAAGHGDVHRTERCGETWTPLTPEGVDVSYRSPIRAIQFQDERRGWVAGMQASLMRTADGGVTWEAATTRSAAGAPGLLGHVLCR